MRRLVLACLLALTAYACGNKGALYLPTSDAKDASGEQSKRR